MIKKLSKHGNSLALLIDKPILELLNITEHTRINITTDGTNIMIKPIHTDSTQSMSDDHKLQKSYEELIENYGTILRKLADH